MKIGIHLSKVCRLDIARTKLGFWEKHAAFEELRGGGGGSYPVDLIDPSASPSWVKYEVALCIRYGITQGYNATSTCSVGHVDCSAVSHAHVPSPKAHRVFASWFKTRQGYPRDA